VAQHLGKGNWEPYHLGGIILDPNTSVYDRLNNLSSLWPRFPIYLLLFLHPSCNKMIMVLLYHQRLPKTPHHFIYLVQEKL